MFVIYYFIYKKWKKEEKNHAPKANVGYPSDGEKTGKTKKGNGKGHTDGNVFHLDKNGSGTSGLY
jgi:hypothetical protein